MHLRHNEWIAGRCLHRYGLDVPARRLNKLVNTAQQGRVCTGVLRNPCPPCVGGFSPMHQAKMLDQRGSRTLQSRDFFGAPGQGGSLHLPC
jgi:hypothetical protein